MASENSNVLATLSRTNLLMQPDLSPKIHVLAGALELICSAVRSVAVLLVFCGSAHLHLKYELEVPHFVLWQRKKKKEKKALDNFRGSVKCLKSMMQIFSINCN